MKKLLALTLCSALALSVFSTGFKLQDNSEKAPASDHAVIITDNTKVIDYTKDPLAAKGLDLISKMDKLAESKEYIDSVSAQQDFKTILDEIAAGDYTTPKAVYKAAVPEGTVPAAMGAPIDMFDEDIRSLIDDRLLASIPSQLNAKDGVESIAALTIVSASTASYIEGVEESQLYIFVYDNGYSAIVSYMPQEKNVVSISAGFVKSEELAAVSSADELNALIKNTFNTDAVKFELVK